MNVKAIARMCHEANAALCAEFNDFSQPLWVDAPDWQIKSAIAGVRYVLENPDAPLSAQHDSWMRHKIDDGWVYGANKDPERKTHPCIVPYGDLPKEQQAKDALFRGIVLALRPLLQYTDGGTGPARCGQPEQTPE